MNGTADLDWQFFVFIVELILNGAGDLAWQFFVFIVELFLNGTGDFGSQFFVFIVELILNGTRDLVWQAGGPGLDSRSLPSVRQSGVKITDLSDIPLTTEVAYHGQYNEEPQMLSL